MPVADLISLLRTDLADPNTERFGDEVLKRCVLKSAFPVARDLGVKMSVTNGEIVPEPEGETLELLLLQAQIAACQFMRAATANSFSFSSGDKSVNKTSQPEHWANLEEDLTTAYNLRLSDIKPGAGDDYILTPDNVVPVIYGPPRHRPWH